MKRLKNNVRKIIIDPFLDFINDSRAVGIILLVCTGISLVIANTNYAATYFNLINIQ